MTTPYGLIFALWAAGLGAAAQYGKVSVVFDLLPELYPQAGAILGLAVSVVGVVGLVFGIAAGLLVARVRYCRALLGALWLGAVLSAAQALLPPFPWLLATRMVEGFSHLAIVVAAPTLIAQLSAARDRELTLTLWGSFFGVAFAILSLLGRPLALTVGVDALFAAHAVYMATIAMFLSARLRALPDDVSEIKFPWSRVLQFHLAIYRSPFLSAPAAGWLFYTFCFVSVLTVLPPFLDPGVRTMVMVAMPLTGIAISLTFGVWLLGRCRAVQVVQLGFALSALCALWLWFAPGDPLACIVLASAMGLVQGASFAAVAQLNSSAAAQAQANGAMAQMGNLGNTIGTPVVAAGLTGMGYSALPLLMGAAFVAGLAVHLVLEHRRNS